MAYTKKPAARTRTYTAPKRKAPARTSKQAVPFRRNTTSNSTGVVKLTRHRLVDRISNKEYNSTLDVFTSLDLASSRVYQVKMSDYVNSSLTGQYESYKIGKVTATFTNISPMTCTPMSLYLAYDPDQGTTVTANNIMAKQGARQYTLKPGDKCTYTFYPKYVTAAPVSTASQWLDAAGPGVAHNGLLVYVDLNGATTGVGGLSSNSSHIRVDFTGTFYLKGLQLN